MASAIQPQDPSQPIDHFLLKCDNNGHWTVRDDRNLVGGTFINKDAAIRFARQESDTLRTR